MDLADRIKTIITVNNLTSSSFADKVGVQRSGVSHILNGRNRPSMDFLLKVIEAFPRVDAGWLLTGKSPESSVTQKSQQVKAANKEPKAVFQQVKSKSSEERSIEKIVIFYTDHTFETYNPNSQ
ncbi:MAG: transcriptional regulator with XRE-family HTH domain [Cryomorphaceae bacterium]|jgi:transcriptional regulator with XRE-family HTH domain